MKAMTYQVWDDDSGNVIASYASREAAITFLRGMLAANGPAGVADLALIEYPSDGSDPITILEGAELLKRRAKAPATRRGPSACDRRPTAPRILLPSAARRETGGEYGACGHTDKSRNPAKVR